MKKQLTSLCLVAALSLLTACGGTPSSTGSSSSTPPSGSQEQEGWKTTGQIELVVPFSPGGSSDLSARALAPYLGEVLGCNIYINNISGASGLTGTAYALEKEPDGYTYVWLGTRAVSPEIYQSIAPYTTEDLAAIAEVTETFSVLAVPANSPFNTAEELFDYCKENPGVKYGHTGRGYKNHITALTMNSTYDLGMVEVPYSSDADACTALLRQEITMGFISLTTAAQQAEAGDLKILAILNENRSEDFPDIPTIGETKYAIPDIVSYIGLFCDVDVDDEIIQAMSDAVKTCFEEYPELTEDLAAIGQSAVYRDHDDFTTLITELNDVIEPVWKEAGLYE